MSFDKGPKIPLGRTDHLGNMYSGKHKTPPHCQTLVQRFQNKICTLIPMVYYNLINLYLYLLNTFLLRES